jgi:hypothetical protein
MDRPYVRKNTAVNREIARVEQQQSFQTPALTGSVESTKLPVLRKKFAKPTQSEFSPPPQVRGIEQPGSSSGS